jgi:hypothetical protein
VGAMAGDVQRRHRGGLSQDPALKANQLANLRQGPQARVTHGMHSQAGKARVAELAETYFAELSASFPNSSEYQRRIQARRLAKMDLFAQFVNERGVIRHRRRGDVFPAHVEEERLASAFERREDLMLEVERQHGASETSIIGAWHLPAASLPAPDGDGQTTTDGEAS